MKGDTSMSFIEELQRECEYDPDGDSPVDALIAYKDALEETYLTAAELVKRAGEVMVLVCDADDDYWSEVATGQDSEQAEDSGYLCGYRDALAAIAALLNDGDPKRLDAYTETVTEGAKQQRRDIAELRGETDAGLDDLSDPSNAEISLLSAFHVDEAGDGRLVIVLVDQSQLEQGYSDIGGSLRLDLTNNEAADLYEQLGRQIGEWASERREARAAVAAGTPLDVFLGERSRAEDDLLEAGDHLRKARRENG